MDPRGAAPSAGRAFRAMGCAAEVTVVGGDEALLGRAHQRLDELEARWSRFRSDSDVSRLNASGGRPLQVDPATTDLVVHLVQAWRATSGAFDPTLLPVSVGLGDAVSWEDPTRVTSLAPGLLGPGEPDAVLVDVAASVVQLPVGTTLDPGGLGKGLAADLVVAELLEAGALGALVSIGGDLRASGAGTGPDGSWIVAVEDPLAGPGEIARVHLSDGGVATSSTRLRRWQVDGVDRHHLVDPATRRPTAEVIVAATVLAGTAAWAEAWTKAVMVRGPQRVLPELDALGLAALAVRADGSITVNDHWGVYAA